MDENTLRQLFARIRRGDRTAEQELHQALRPRLRSIAFGRGVRGCDLEDVVQDALSAVLFHVRNGGFKELSSPSTWMTRILLNKVADCFRARVRSETLLAAVADQTLLDTVRRPNQHIRLEVMQALARLTPAERFVLMATELLGLTYEEVATRLRCPPGTVASTKNRAASRFREFFRGPRRPDLRSGVRIAGAVTNPTRSCSTIY